MVEVFEVGGQLDGVEQAFVRRGNAALELSHVLLDGGQVEQLVTRGSFHGADLETPGHDLVQVLGVDRRDSLELSFLHFLVQLFHLPRVERRASVAHLVHDAAQRPDVALGVVGFVSPHFWTGVVWRAGLRVDQSVLHDFRNVQVSELYLGQVFAEEDVRGLEVAVHDVQAVEVLQAAEQLDQVAPDELFGDECFFLLALGDLLVEVSPGQELHHDAERVVVFVDESFFVTDDRGVVDRSENPNLVECVLFFFVLELRDLHFLQRVDQPVGPPDHFVHHAERSFSDFAQRLEVRETALAFRLVH